MHTIILRNSNPSLCNDDLVMSEDFETYADAKSAFDKPSELPQGIQREIRSAALQGYELWMELDSENGYESKCICEETERGAEYRRREDEMWRREQAMEAGMAFGCDGYNDFMGY